MKGSLNVRAGVKLQTSPKLAQQDFWSLVSTEPTETGCYLWLGSVNTSGYGMFRGVNAHRTAYRLVLGDIPPGHTLHHLCGTQLCVNPHHLTPLTRTDHSRVHKEARSAG